MPIRVPNKVRFVKMVQHLALVTPGGGTSWEYLEVEGPADWGPRLLEITTHQKTYARTSNFGWKPVFFASFDGGTWAGPYDLRTTLIAKNQSISAPYTTVANFNARMRFAVAYRALSGTAVESGMITFGLAFKFKT